MMMKHYIAAALAGLALSACSEQKQQPSAPAPIATEEPKPVNLPLGFYRATSGKAQLIDPAYGFENIVATLNKNTCLKVIDGLTNKDHARVELRLAFAPEDRVQGYVLKSELSPAPDCRELVKGPPMGDPANPTGYRLFSNAILYATKQGGEPVGRLRAGDCVKIEEQIRPEQQTRLSATVGGHALSGWTFDAKIDPNNKCALGL
jgi:hypothetical protein